MNIVKIQKQLQNVPDSALVGYVQNPDGQVPSYLALSELNRRKELRADYQKQAAPEKSVAEGMVEEASGIQALPQAPQGQPQQMAQAPQQPMPQGQPQQMAEGGLAQLDLPDDMFNEESYAAGGIVAFGGGGLSEYDPNYHGYPVDAPGLSEADLAYADALHNSPIAQYGGKALKTLLAPAYVMGNKAVDYLSGIKPVWDPKTGKLVHQSDLNKVDPEAAYQAEGKAGLKERQDYLNANPAVSPAYTAKKVNQDDLVRQQKTAEFLKNDAAKQIAAAEDKKAQDAQIQAAIDASVKPARDNTLVKSKRTGNESASAVPAYNKVTATTIPDFATDFANLQRPDLNVQDQIKAYNESLGKNEGLAALKERITAMEGKATKAEEEAPWMALAKAGFAMASGTSRNALQNISQGAMEGLKEYNAAKEKLSAAEEKRFDLASRLAQAERAEQVAAAKFGWDSVEHRDAQNQATKLAGLTHKASVAATNATNQLNADSANAKNALDAQQNMFTHQYQMGSLDAQRTSAAKLSDYETYLQDAKKDKRNWSMVDGKPVFDIDKVTVGYRGYDVKSRGQDLQTLQKQYAAELDPKKKEYIGMQIQAILSGGDPSAVSTVPGITAPRADLFKPVK